MSSKRNFSKLFSVVIAAIVLSITIGFVKADAATLSISPASGAISVGKTISVQVIVNSNGQSINAVSGGVTFSNDLLTLTGMSKSGSIVSLWAQDPSYSNASGTATFQGVILNGYSGSYGKILTLTFKAKAEGTATIGIASSSSSVLLNDGQGTNVLSGTNDDTVTIGKGSVSVVQPSTPQAVTVSTIPVTPNTPTILPTVLPSGATPLFTDYENPLLPGNFVVVKGKAAPNSIVTITLSQSAENGDTTVSQSTIPTNSDGVFTFVSNQKVSQGYTYRLVASTSPTQVTAPLTISVKNSLGFVIAIWISALIAIKISLLLALVIILIITAYFIYQNRVLKKHLVLAIGELHHPPEK